MIEACRQWLMRCPLLKEDAPFFTEKLESTVTNYDISVLPCQPVAVEYRDGSSRRVFKFAFSSCESFTAADTQENAKFYEKLMDWVEHECRFGKLPELSGRKSAQNVEILSYGYVLDAEQTHAIYQIEMQLVYFQPRKIM